MFLNRARLRLPGLLGGALLLLGSVGDAAGFDGCAHHGAGHAIHASSHENAADRASSDEGAPHRPLERGPLEHVGTDGDGTADPTGMDDRPAGVGEHDCDGRGCDCDCPFVCVGSAGAERPPSGAAIQAALAVSGQAGSTLAAEEVERHHPRTLPYFIPYSQAPPARS